MDPKILDDLARRVSSALPPGLSELQHDVEKNIRAAIQSAFARLDLVTREEFDVQTGVLARTRSKLEDLERQVALLEKLVLTQSGTEDKTESDSDQDGY
jgi:BMFP domain-containing protein YqiC